VGPLSRLAQNGDEGGVLFVTADDELWTLITQYIKGRHDFSTRYAEDVFHVLLHQASDQKRSVCSC
jgi:hypothetical protein